MKEEGIKLFKVEEYWKHPGRKASFGMVYPAHLVRKDRDNPRWFGGNTDEPLEKTYRHHTVKFGKKQIHGRWLAHPFIHNLEVSIHGGIRRTGGVRRRRQVGSLCTVKSSIRPVNGTYPDLVCLKDAPLLIGPYPEGYRVVASLNLHMKTLPVDLLVLETHEFPERLAQDFSGKELDGEDMLRWRILAWNAWIDRMAGIVDEMPISIRRPSPE